MRGGPCPGPAGNPRRLRRYRVGPQGSGGRRRRQTTSPAKTGEQFRVFGSHPSDGSTQPLRPVGDVLRDGGPGNLLHGAPFFLRLAAQGIRLSVGQSQIHGHPEDGTGVVPPPSIAVWGCAVLPDQRGWASAARAWPISCWCCERSSGGSTSHSLSCSEVSTTRRQRSNRRAMNASNAV